MPIFEYTCVSCGAEFEALILARGQEENTSCPACGKKNITKKLSVFSPSVPSGLTPRCDATGECVTPNLPGCASGACGLA